ncbi:MAG: hypothetical protein JWR67_3737 [Mucilaginibacter sp.]|nr:hypothetical protein [Mucilaginibacter sp.]
MGPATVVQMYYVPSSGLILCQHNIYQPPAGARMWRVSIE